MSLNESDTRAKLIDPALHQVGWTEDLVKREETAGTVDIIGDKARRRSRGKMDYVLRVRVNVDTQPVALALIEAKREELPPGHGLEQAKSYAECKRLNVKFVFSSNGHRFVEYDFFTGRTSPAQPMSTFPTYDMAQAIEDGYLAACEIQKGRVDIDDTGITQEEIIARNPVDAVTGLPVTARQIDELYKRTQYEDRIMLPDRVLAMCRDLFQYLLATGGPEQKTIIFCARDRHADDVAACLSNLYADWCTAVAKPRLEPFAFKCTAASSGNDQLPDFRAASRSHFIATTVDLLSTGVDVPCVRNIVFFKYLKSPISFYQMVGRGTRIDAPTNKLMFRVYDYTDATSLFGEDFETKHRTPSGGGTENPPPPPRISIQVEGFEVHVTDAGRFIVAQVDGKAMPIPVEEYKAQLAARLVSEVHTLSDFRMRWIDPPSRHELLDMLVASGYSPTVLQRVEELDNYDLYDVLAELGWALRPAPARSARLPSPTSTKTGSTPCPHPPPPRCAPSRTSSGSAAPTISKTATSSRRPRSRPQAASTP